MTIMRLPSLVLSYVVQVAAGAIPDRCAPMQRVCAWGGVRGPSEKQGRALEPRRYKGDGAGHGLIDGHGAGVDLHGILGGTQGRIGAAHVTGVAVFHLRQHLCLIAAQFQPTPMGADLSTGGDIELNLRLGANDRADVAAIQHRAAVRRAKRR